MINSNANKDRLSTNYLFFGGESVTMAKGCREAVLTKGDRILATGDLVQLRDIARHELAGDVTEIDLENKVLLPGFIEPHSHILWAAQTRGDPVVDIRALVEPTFAQVMDKIRRRMKHAEKDEWIVFFGLDAQLHNDMVFPDKDMLDEIAPNNPIAIQTSNCHALYMNSKALEVCGLDQHTPDKPGGVIERFEDGRPTGKVMEMTTWLVLEKFYQAWGASRLSEELVQSANRFLAQGITTVTEHLYVPYYKGFYLDALNKGHPLPRIAAYQQATTGDMQVDELDDTSDQLWMAGVKIHADGSPFIGNIWLSEPYLETPTTLERMDLKPGHTGRLNYEMDYFSNMVRQYFKQGWQMSIHTQGDRTIDMVLDLVESLLQEQPTTDHRFRLEHCALMRIDQIERAHRLGVLCSFFISHIRFWGAPIEDMLFGPKRAAHYMPAGSAANMGMRISLHADTPMTDASALLLMQTAITRKTQTEPNSQPDRVIGAGECISPIQALRAVTIDAAYQIGMEDKIGSIEADKYADFVILDANPATTNPEALHEINVMATYIGGQLVFEAE